MNTYIFILVTQNQHSCKILRVLSRYRYFDASISNSNQNKISMN